MNEGADEQLKHIQTLGARYAGVDQQFEKLKAGFKKVLAASHESIEKCERTAEIVDQFQQVVDELGSNVENIRTDIRNRVTTCKSLLLHKEREMAAQGAMQQRYMDTIQELYMRFLWYKKENERLTELLAFTIKESEREVSEAREQTRLLAAAMIRYFLHQQEKEFAENETKIDKEDREHILYLCAEAQEKRARHARNARDFKGLDKKKEGDPTENLGPIRDRPYPRMELKPRMVPSLIEQRW